MKKFLHCKRILFTVGLPSAKLGYKNGTKCHSTLRGCRPKQSKSSKKWLASTNPARSRGRATGPRVPRCPRAWRRDALHRRVCVYFDENLLAEPCPRALTILPRPRAWSFHAARASTIASANSVSGSDSSSTFAPFSIRHRRRPPSTTRFARFLSVHSTNEVVLKPSHPRARAWKPSPAQWMIYIHRPWTPASPTRSSTSVAFSATRATCANTMKPSKHDSPRASFLRSFVHPYSRRPSSYPASPSAPRRRPNRRSRFS